MIFPNSVARAVLAAAAGFLCGSHTLAGPSVATSWRSTGLTQQECVQRAERVLRDAEMAQDFEVVGQSVFGGTGGYTLLVRCITEKGLVYFAVGGPSHDEAQRYLTTMSGKF
jgi:hypothetical protein